MQDEYGAAFRPFQIFRSRSGKINQLEKRISQVIAGGANTPQKKYRLAELMAARDKLIAKAAAKKGAALAAASIPGVAGGLASSGIRGMDVVEHEFTPEVVRGHNLEGAAQGLRQTSVAPPGSGRLVPIPFVAAGAVDPVVVLTGGAANVIGAQIARVTTAVSWAVLRIVALTTQILQAPTASAGLMQDMRIGGSPNLFLVEDWVTMDDYDVDKEAFVGLRAYPVLISPNTALITLAARGGTAGGELVYAQVNLVCEVLRDDAFGPGLPGAYAR